MIQALQDVHDAAWRRLPNIAPLPEMVDPGATHTSLTASVTYATEHNGIYTSTYLNLLLVSEENTSFRTPVSGPPPEGGGV